MHEFRLGETLGRGFEVFFKNFVSFTLLMALIYSPLLIYTFVVVTGDLTLDGLQRWAVIVGVGSLALYLIATAAVIYGTFEHLRGRRASIGKSISVGIKRMLPVLGVGLLVVLLVAAGFIALIVPGVILLCMLYVALPVAVVERPGVSASLTRSRDLTSGYRWHIFGILAILFGIRWGTSRILEAMFVDIGMSMTDVKIYITLALVAEIILAALGSVVNAVAYHDLRVAKEGIGTEELASIFD